MVVTRHHHPPEMDPRIWCRLPEHLLDLVLSFLSLETFLKLTPTCKRFSSLISSPQFVSKHAMSSSPLPSFLLLSHPQLPCRRLPLFDAVLSSWRTLALPGPGRCPAPPLLCSVSRGLLCFSIPHRSSFLVSSLVAGSKRTVKFPVFDLDFDLVTLVCSSVGFKVFLLCSSSSSNFAYLYDSVSDRWTRFDRVGAILTGNHHQEGVFYNGCLYFVAPEPFSIVNFDLKTGDWGTGSIALPNELTFARLVSNRGGKLYLIGGIGQHGISRGIKIWELSENGIDWVEIESLPDMICKKFMSICYHNYEHVYCFWHQGLICVCCYNWPEVLYYKVSRATWHWLPKNPSLPEKWSFGFRWFSLVPEIHTFI